MEPGRENNLNAQTNRRFGCLHVAIFLLIAVILTAGVTFWVVRAYIFPSEFEPVTLNAKEQQVLNAKLERLDSFNEPGERRRSSRWSARTEGKNDALEPEPYNEDDARREISLTEKELNALLAKNTDLARKLAIDLSQDLVSAKLLVPIDEDFPMLGGQILKVRAGLELAYHAGKPIVVLRGISVMGVPIPNAWLGGMKNIDLVREFGAERGFWKAFSEGVENISVEDGRLKIKLKE